MILKWTLDDDGGGEWITFKAGTSPSMVAMEKQDKDTFESLDELPKQWAELIKADGRRQGELELAEG